MERKTAKKNKAPRSIRIADLLAILVLLVIAASLLTMAVRYVRYLALDIRLAEHSTPVVDFDAQMIVLRTEYPIYAGREGEFTPILEEGQRVKEGEQIGYIQWESGPQHPVLASHTGLVSYAIDGWESLLTPEAADTTDWLKVLDALDEDASRNAEVVPDLSAGRTVAKVVDNLIPPMLFFHADDLPDRLAEEGNCRFLLSNDPDGTQPLQAQAGEVISLADGSQYFFAELSSMDSRMYGERIHQVSIIDQSISGVSVPLTAIHWDEESNRPFVYRCDRSHLELVEVKIIYQADKTVFVEGVTLGDRIVVNENRARDGQKIYGK